MAPGSGDPTERPAEGLQNTIGDLLRLMVQDRERAAVVLHSAASQAAEHLIRARRVQRADAEDLVQELILRFLKRKPSWLAQSAPEKKLVRRLEAVLWSRSRHVLRSRRRLWTMDPASLAERTWPDGDLLPRKEASGVEEEPGVPPDAPSLEDALRHIPRRERDVLRARSAGVSARELARRLHIRRDSVRRLARRAVQHAATEPAAPGTRKRRCVVPHLSEDIVEEMGPQRRRVYDLARAHLTRAEIAREVGWKATSVKNELARIRTLAR